MAIPDYQAIMLPLLRLAGDHKEHTISEAVQVLADQFGLTPEERSHLLPSGKQATFNNRVGWARTYLAKARLLVEGSRRGSFRLSDRGAKVLATQPDSIDVQFLGQFPEFVEFKSASRRERTHEATEPDSPEEVLESSYQTIRTALAHELLDRIKQCSPRFFEMLVVDLLVAMGYGGTHKDAASAVGGSGDGGIDGIIKEDKLGLDIVYIQAKRQEGSVGRPTVQAFAGSLEGQRARKGVLITTSHFTSDAREYVEKIEKKIVLIDGEQLAQLMIDHGVGVATASTYEVKKIDEDYFTGF